MTNELSDVVEKKGKAILKRGPPPGKYYLDGCHAKLSQTGSLDLDSLLGHDLTEQLGGLAVQAGYSFGDEFEYKIVIKKK